jgi:hypothetical protein
LFILGFSWAAAQNRPQPFSSDFIFTEGSFKSTGKIYFSWPNYRMDIESIISIANYETKRRYAIFLDQHKYFETRGNEYLFDAQDPCLKRPDLTCKKIGPVALAGRRCDKWETTDKQSGRVGDVCVDQELHFPISVHNSNGTSFEYINIKPGPQAESLFAPPAGYERVPDILGP